MQNITFNGLNLQTSGYIVSAFNHEGISTDQAKMKIPHRDGQKLTSFTYGPRAIHLEGSILAATAAALDAAVDAFKQSTIGALGVNLDFDYQGTTRRYIVNTAQVSVARSSENITYVPFKIDAEAINPPFGMNTAAQAGYQNATVSGTWSTTISGTVSNLSFTVSGTTNPQPQIKFTVTTKGSMTGFQFNNTTTNTSMTVNFTPANSDVITIDCGASTVKQNTTSITTYTGIFPTFSPGVNNFTLTVYGSSNNFVYGLEIDYTPYWL